MAREWQLKRQWNGEEGERRDGQGAARREKKKEDGKTSRMNKGAEGVG